MTAAGEARGQRIGRYRIEQVIGTGAFATVYRATDDRLDGTVVVKLLADNHCLDPDIRARFVGEGRALRRIDSPHVVRVFDAGETDRLQPYLVIEHADRGSLAHRVAGLRAGGWRPDRAAVAVVVAELAAAVGAVHAAGLVHRDLSPNNVLLRSVPATPAGSSGSGQPAAAAAAGPPGPAGPAGPATGGLLVRADERLVLADLGLSKDLARSSGLTVAGGTDGFRPPEQRSGPATVDSRADLWGLSAVVYWLLTGEAPGDTGPDAGGRAIDRALAGLGFPAALGRALRQGLADDPAGRPPDVAAWRAAMEQALQPPAPPPGTPAPSALGAPGAPGATGAAGRQRPWRSGRATLLATALVALGALLGGAAVALLGDPGDGGESWTTTRRSGGQVRREATDSTGEGRLTLVGPERATVGQTARFSVDAREMDRWVWLMPDGAVYPDATEVQLRTTSAGTAEVTVLGIATSGERLEIVHELRVTGE